MNLLRNARITIVYKEHYFAKNSEIHGYSGCLLMAPFKFLEQFIKQTKALPWIATRVTFIACYVQQIKNKFIGRSGRPR